MAAAISANGPVLAMGIRVAGGMTVDFVASWAAVQGWGGLGARNRKRPPVGAP